MSKAFEKIKAGLEHAAAYASDTGDRSKYRVHYRARSPLREDECIFRVGQEHAGARSAGVSPALKARGRARSTGESV
jgi:hypothetical protein